MSAQEGERPVYKWTLPELVARLNATEAALKAERERAERLEEALEKIRERSSVKGRYWKIANDALDPPTEAEDLPVSPKSKFGI